MKFRSYFNKKRKILSGLFNENIPYDIGWWDNKQYKNGISDAKTIDPNYNVVIAQYHYASLETIILRHLCNSKIDLNQSRILDIGSGAGHWIDFYNRLSVKNIDAIEASYKAHKYLDHKYDNYININICPAKVPTGLYKLTEKYNIVNAIGVMFHIIPDHLWAETIESINEILLPAGLFIASGHFGFLNGLNVQVEEGRVNKRLRSKQQWIYRLKRAGFTNIKFYKNNAYLYIDHPLPENNVMVAMKR